MDLGQSTCRRVGWQVQGHPLFTPSVNTQRSLGEQTAKYRGLPRRCRNTNTVNSIDTIHLLTLTMYRQGTRTGFITSADARAPVVTSTDERLRNKLKKLKPS